MATGLSSLENLVKCALCLEGYKTPRVLPCQHCFCEDCLTQDISKNSKPGGTFECPSCRQEVDIPKEGVAGFPVSFTLNKLQDTLDKLSKQKCNNYEKSGTTKVCLKCFPSHHHSTSETSTDDPTAELGGAFGGLESIILESIFCKTHPKKHMSLYCEDCKEAICNACTANHKRHVIIDGEEKASLEETSISENVAKMITKQQLCQDQGDLKEEKVTVRCNVDEVISQVKSRCKDICKQVTSAEKEIISQLTKECAEIETRIDKKMEENVTLSHKLESCIEKQQGLRKTPAFMILIQEKQKLEPEVEELTKAKINRIEEHIQWRFVPGTMNANSVKDLVGTLQTSYIRSSSGIEPIYEHKSTETEASARNLPHKPFISHSLGEKEAGCAIVICEDGEVYVATNRGIKAYSAAAVYTHTIAHDTDAFSIAELPGGKLAISCYNDENVKVFSKDGSYVHTVAAGPVAPWGMALLHNGALAVCYPDEKCVRVFKDCGERAAVVSVIRRFTLDRSKQQPTTRRQEERGFKRPCYLTAHGENGLIVSDWEADAVYAFTAGEKGEYTCQWMYGGERGRRSGMLHKPRGVATDSQGRVLIADCRNYRVLLLSHDGDMLMELLTQHDGLDRPLAMAVGAGKLAVRCVKTAPKIYNYL